MRDFKRIKVILNILQEIWEMPKNQDLRFWQLLTFIKNSLYTKSTNDLFYLEDDKFIEKLKEFKQEL